MRDSEQRSRGLPATVWSFSLSTVVIGIWVVLVAVNRATQGEVHLHGGLAHPLALWLWVWIALGGVACVLAVLGIIRSRQKGLAVIALCLALFLELVGALSWY